MSFENEDIWAELLNHPRWGQKSPERYIIPWIENLTVKGQKALDVGCGWGRHLVVLCKAGLDTTGLDSSAGMLEAAKELLETAGCKAQLIKSDASEIPFAAESFDLVLTTYASHHGDRRFMVRCIDEIRRVLVEGGHLIATFPTIHDSRANRGMIIEPGTVIPDKDDPEEGIPHHFCSEEELRGWLKNFEFLHFEEISREPEMVNIPRERDSHFFVVAMKKSVD